MPKQLSTKTPHQRTPLPPSILDQLEAMVRHPEFQRLLLLWRSILAKNDEGLTEEEQRERDAPRTRIRIAAWMEAESRWLSRSIQQIREHGEAAWADEAVNGPWGDTTNTILPNRLVPGDLPLDDTLPIVGEHLRHQRRQLGIAATQRPRPHEVDKWTVYDLRTEGLSFWDITRRLFDLDACKTTYDAVAQTHYAKVRRAYRAAHTLTHTLAE